MTKSIAIVFLLLACSGQAGGTCIVEPIAKQVAAADTVFIATILSAKAEDPDKALQHGKYFLVTYSFSVRKVIKGDPSRVTALYTQRLYSDPLATDVWTLPEDESLSPGDSVVVVADKPGRAYPGSCGTSVHDFAKYAREHDL